VKLSKEKNSSGLPQDHLNFDVNGGAVEGLLESRLSISAIEHREAELVRPRNPTDMRDSILNLKRLPLLSLRLPVVNDARSVLSSVSNVDMVWNSEMT